MEIIGKVKELCDLVQGTTEAGNWCKRDLVVSTAGDEPRDVAVTFFGDRRVSKLSEVRPGDMVQVTAVVKSRKSDMRWFTTVDGISIAVLQRQVIKMDAPAEGDAPY